MPSFTWPSHLQAFDEKLLLLQFVFSSFKYRPLYPDFTVSFEKLQSREQRDNGEQHHQSLLYTSHDVNECMLTGQSSL